MQTAVFQAKLDRFFDILDVNRDGHVAQDDFDSIVHQVVVAPGSASGAARGQAVRDAAGRFWTGVQAHATPDSAGRIDRPSFRAAMGTAFRERDQFDELIAPALEAWFDLYDADVDGRIGRAEYEVLQRTLGRSEADIDHGFRAIDVNGDGYLTLAEFIAVLRDYFTSEDPNAPGNEFFGPIS